MSDEQQSVIWVELKSIKEELRELNKKVWSTQPCPSPGACIPLQATAADHERRLRLLEKLSEQAEGAGKLARLLWSVVGGSVVAFFSWLFKHI